MLRRQFVKNSLVLSGFAVLGSSLISAVSWAANKCNLLDMSGKSTDATMKQAVGIATGIKYVDDVAAAAKAGKFKRKNENDFCETCQFYNKVTGQCGTCTLILPTKGVHVAAKGSCISWVKKAGS